MSQMTVSAARLARPAARSRVVTSSAAASQANALFRAVCVFIVLVGMAAVLMLNTARAESSYILGRLQVEATAVHDRVSTLEGELTHVSSSESLARQARRLDMVPATSTSTLRLSDGSLSGVASMTDGERTITVDLPSTGVVKDDDSEG